MDVAPQGASALFLDFDERRELVFEKIVENLDFKKFLASQAGSIFQKSWEGEYFFNSRRRLVVLADASLATTIPVPLDFKREASAAADAITLGEVEDWFARATAKIFTQCRVEAGRRLGTSDIDTVLVSQRIARVAIDGRVVADPVGHAGKKVSFVIELTFSNRELSEALAPFFNAPGEFFFAEAPQAQLAALARVRKAPISIVSARDDGKSSLFVFQQAEQGCPVVYREPFPWNGGSAIRAIAADLGIVPSSAEEAYGMYVRGEVSDTVKKHFDDLSAPAIEHFLQALDKANLSGPAYLDAPRALPLKLPHRRRRAVIEDVPLAALLEKFGFSIARGELVPSRIALRFLAPFFELYFGNGAPELGELLRRKLHWLA